MTSFLSFKNPLTSLTFVMFCIVACFWITLASHLPYISPDYLNPFLIFISTPLLSIWFYWHDYRKNGTLSVSKMDAACTKLERLGNNIFSIAMYRYFGPFFMACLINYCLYLLIVTLTLFFAYKPLVENVTVQSIECNKSSRSTETYTRIIFTKPIAIGQFAIEFNENICEEIQGFQKIQGKTITLYGRSWFLGSYIHTFGYNDYHIPLDPETDGLIRKVQKTLMKYKTLPPIEIPNPPNHQKSTQS